MTRPGGVTPNRSLPYPGSNGIHAATPAALQALAEAIDAQLGALPGGIIFDVWAATVTLDTTAGFTPVFANLASVDGFVANYGIYDGATFKWAWASGGPGDVGANTGKGFVTCASNLENMNSVRATICAYGWGPRR